MANVQKENGYTQIANEILEHLCLPGISGSEYRVLIAVIRKTYGFKKKKDRISLSQFQKLTYMNRTQAVRTIKSLVSKRILVKDGSTYKFNKNWDEWVVSKRSSVQKDTVASIQLDTKTSIQKDTHKRKKEIITKEIDAEKSAGQEVNEIIYLFRPVNPTIERCFPNKTERAAVARMLKAYGRDGVEEMIASLPVVNAKPYWPKSTTPTQLERNIPIYKAKNDESKTQKSKTKATIIS